MADPTERWTRLSGRHLLLLGALVARQMEMQGAGADATRLREARSLLAEVTAEELAVLAERLDAELLRRWTQPAETEEQRREPPTV